MGCHTPPTDTHPHYFVYSFAYIPHVIFSLRTPFSLCLSHAKSLLFFFSRSILFHFFLFYATILHVFLSLLYLLAVAFIRYFPYAFMVEFVVMANCAVALFRPNKCVQIICTHFWSLHYTQNMHGNAYQSKYLPGKEEEKNSISMRCQASNSQSGRGTALTEEGISLEDIYLSCVEANLFF